MLRKVQAAFPPPKEKRQLTDEEKDQIVDAFKQFRNTLICGATFSVFRDLITISFEEQRPPFDLTSLVLDSLDTGLELSSFGLVDSLLRISIKPDLRTLKRWVPWTIATSAITACANRAIQVPLQNKYHNNKLSYKGYFTGLGKATSHAIGFNTCAGLAYHYLPKNEKMGGEFARSTSAITIGSFGATIASTPFVNAPIPKILRDFWHNVPLIMLDNSMFTIVQKTTEPMLK
ncbi:hypothetical protein TRFO_41481 [Tritrichomonas foetus]|uniref:Mitochondrial carrier protein n=1 Tax=Tritrichomonas foetus TaxID=1144522 RepID=A0A1J4L4I6_9EUKA|nr:hypothetical protein TRFO_41481 [Tritrichomonas foetus]|eukprot:OHT16884.1 hypothetical protein TRFO_41481 [Tritrichomonas foetus]